MKNLIKLLSVAALFTVTFIAKAQVKSYYADIEGRPFKEMKEDNTIGTPFLVDAWGEGIVTTDKQTYTGLKLKYDEKNDALIFQAKDGLMMNFAEPVKKFTIGNSTYANGYPPTGKQNKQSYYLLLSTGHVPLLKHSSKAIQENKSYGESTSTREYVTIDSYYTLQGDKMESFKPDRKTISKLMADKSSAVDTYLEKNKINFKNDADLTKLFDWYNGL